MHTKFVHKLLTSHTFIHLVMEKLFVAKVRFCMMQENFFFLVKPIYKMQCVARHVDGLENTTKNLTDDLIPVLLSNPNFGFLSLKFKD